MNLILPMAGMGKRLRPHTLTVPKPLFKIAGVPIVERLIKYLATLTGENFEKVGFVTGDFKPEVKAHLLELAANIGSDGKLFYQKQPLGTAHAVYCAEELLEGEVMVAFTDTLFDGSFELDRSADAVVFTKKVDDPSRYGVVKLAENQQVIEFVEKPATFVSDLAIIGIYYFKYGEVLADKIRFLLNNEIKVKGEYQLTDALDLMLKDGYVFKAQTVDGWYDCGNKDLVISTMKQVLAKEGRVVKSNFVEESAVLKGNYYVGNNVRLKNSILKGNVVIEDEAVVEDSILEDVIILDGAYVKGVNLKNTIIDQNAQVVSEPKELSVGAYTKLNL